MLFARSEANTRIKAFQGAKGYCPGCGADLIPKCGEVNIHHWAHKGVRCKFEQEPESLWHLDWKLEFWDDAIEIDFGSHRADVYLPELDLVIEFQKSNLTISEAIKRENFYRRVLWVFDINRFWHQWVYEKYSPHGLERPSILSPKLARFLDPLMGAVYIDCGNGKVFWADTQNLSRRPIRGRLIDRQNFVNHVFRTYPKNMFLKQGGTWN